VDDIYARQFEDILLASRVVGAFGVLSFILAAAGVYAVMAFLVATRSKEIGLRMALGATPSVVIRFVMGSSLRVIVGGLAVGLGAAMVASPLVQPQLFQIGARDGATYILVSAVVLIAAALATWRPARHASRVDPALSLRN
jgi:ABC-type antimicrobial peptide transport system permease subunit